MKYTENDESIRIALSILNGSTKLEYWSEKDEIESAMKKISFQYTKKEIKSLHTMSRLGAKWIAGFIRDDLGHL